MVRFWRVVSFFLLLLLLTACPGTSGDSAPTISSFAATPNAVAAGQAVTLSWQVAGVVTSLSIDNGVGNVTGTQTTVFPAATTTYTLTAANAAGGTTATATVTVGGSPTGTAPTGSFGVGLSQSEVHSDAGTAITSPSDPRVVHVSARGSFFAVANYADADGISSMVPYIANSTPAGMSADLTEGTPVNGFTLTTLACDLAANPTNVTCVYQIGVGSIPNISALPGAGGEFAYVFKLRATDTTGAENATSTRGYVVVGGGATTDPTDPTDATDPTDPTNPTVQHTLTVTKPTNGEVAATGIACGDVGSSCQKAYPAGTVVTLTATPAAGYKFDAWGGACSGAGACKLKMDADKTVSATFAPLPNHTLTVTAPTNGKITATGIDCGNGATDCDEVYSEGTTVQLKAEPDVGWTVDSWTGACAGSSTTCTLTVDADKSVSVTFTAAATPKHLLTVKNNTNDGGLVTSSPGTINCPSVCSESFDEGTTVTLTASPAANYTVLGWFGACNTATPVCTVKMNGDRTVNVIFNYTPGP